MAASKIDISGGGKIDFSMGGTMSGQIRDETDCCLPSIHNLSFDELAFFPLDPINLDIYKIRDKDTNLLPSTMTFELLNFLPVLYRFWNLDITHTLLLLF